MFKPLKIAIGINGYFDNVPNGTYVKKINNTLDGLYIDISEKEYASLEKLDCIDNDGLFDPVGHDMYELNVEMIGGASILILGDILGWG